MPANKPQTEAATIDTSPAAAIPVSQSTRRAGDFGEYLLQTMEHFVTLVRRVKRPLLLLHLIQRVCHEPAQQDLEDICKSAKSTLSPAQRCKLYEWVNTFAQDDRLKLEDCAERIHALKDEFGVQAVLALLDANMPEDASILAEPTDKFSRALYLFLAQEYPGAGCVADSRFEQVEWQQMINQQWGNQEYASHFLGPVASQPKTDEETLAQLRTQLASLYTNVLPEEIVVQHFCRMQRSHANRHDETNEQGKAEKLQHTIIATFNGTKAFFKQVDQQEVIEKEEPAALDVVFSWESETGMLGVFCPDKSLRRTLANLFHSILLDRNGSVTDTPMCEFDLSQFASRTILRKIDAALISGVNSVSIQKIRLTNMRPTDSTMRNRESRQLCSHLEISRDRRDSRDVYQVGIDAFGLQTLNGADISRVTMNLGIARQPNRRAHSITVQITLPNGLSNRCKTADDRRLMREQLIKLGVMTEVAMA